MCSTFRVSQKFLCWRLFENTFLCSLYLPIGKLLFAAGLPKDHLLLCYFIQYLFSNFHFCMICFNFWFNWKSINCLIVFEGTFQHSNTWNIFSLQTLKKKKKVKTYHVWLSQNRTYLTDTILIFIGILARWYYGLSGHNHVPQRDFVILKYLFSSFYHLGRTEKRNTFKVVLCHCYMKKVF